MTPKMKTTDVEQSWTQSLMISPPNTEATKHGCNMSKRKKIIGGFLVLGVLLLVAGLFYLGFSGIWKPRGQENAKLETCSREECVHAATEILRHIDVRADPCDDFYRFSCGNFLQNTYLRDNRGFLSESRSVKDVVEDEIQSRIRYLLELPIRREDPKSFNVAKRFYRACMNETEISRQGLKKIKKILEIIGGWPTIQGYNWNHESFDWMESVHKLRAMGVNADIFFRITVDKDDRGPNARYVLGIHEVAYESENFSAELKSLIAQYMIDISILFGGNRNIAADDARETLRLLGELRKIHRESVFENVTQNNWERRSISELQYKYPDIQWHPYLSGILNPTAHISFDDEVIITHPRYVEFLENFLAVTSKRSLANLICWHALSYLINYMPSEIVDKTYELVDRINGGMMKLKQPRHKTCVMETEKSLGPVLSAAYIQNYFPEDTRYKVLIMVRNIKTQAEDTIRRLEWMDAPTKQLIIQTLHSSVDKVPSTGDLLNLFEENKATYSQIKMNESLYLEAALQLSIINSNKQIRKLGTVYEEDLLSDYYFITGLEIKYCPKKNQLTFPVGIFGGVYYQNNRPEYMNYGILGSIIAHEVSHIFMRAVRGDLPSGELRSWWSSNSLANYDQKLQCLSNQYSNFRLPELRHKHLNLAKTRDEDMADLAGMKISYDTYINWSRENGAQPLLPGLNYSPNQLFWISAAIRHCSKYTQDGLGRYIDNYSVSPQQIRVNGPLQNLESFAFDFGCKRGSNMYPETRCDVW